ncbi:MAG: hypothetical protein ACLVGL_16230 [Waltera sp.]
MTAEVMMKEYKNMKKELTVTEFQLRQFQGVSEQDMIDSMLYSHQEGKGCRRALFPIKRQT